MPVNSICPPLVKVTQRERWFRTRAGIMLRFPPDFSEHLTQWMSQNVRCVWVNGAWNAQLSPCSGSEFCNKYRYTRQQRTKNPWAAQMKSWASGNYCMLLTLSSSLVIFIYSINSEIFPETFPVQYSSALFIRNYLHHPAISPQKYMY